jgi:hypothetical protein
LVGRWSKLSKSGGKSKSKSEKREARARTGGGTRARCGRRWGGFMLGVECFLKLYSKNDGNLLVQIRFRNYKIT